ncbi:hypothetical protein [Geminicoccus harenae]|uniref:hypothetical protein n=1 Tax=Geminicoccus harenae TaxID=2498453 RepID=UPI00168A5C8D|nr:hypothetical protein [Geminicoccus harenae]
MERRFLAFFVLTATLLTGLTFGVNCYVDPFGRWAAVDESTVAGRPAYTLNRRLFKLIAFDHWMTGRAGEEVSVLIGDSTTNQIDADDLTRLTGRPWYNLAYGGAGLAETIDLVEHVMERHPLAQIVWGVPFARLVAGAENEIPHTIDMVDAPLRHMLTFESLHASYLVLRATWLGIGFEDPRMDTGDQDIVTYQLSRARSEIAGRPWPDQELAKLAATVEKAQDRGVSIVLLSPPVHPRTAEFYRTSFAERHARYLALLDRHCVINFNEADHRADWPAQMFVDASHLTTEHKPLLTEDLAQALGVACAKPLIAAR